MTDLVQMRQEIEELRNLVEMFAWRCLKEPEKEALRYKTYGNWRSISYREWFASVTILADALKSFFNKGDFAAILSANRPEWTFADIAVMSLGGIVVPIYPSNRAEDVAYILNNCNANIIFLSNKKQLEKILLLKETNQIPNIKRIITFDEIDFDEDYLISISTLMKKGRLADESEFSNSARLISKDSVMTLIYTSGTTGNPKGVMLTHDNILSNMLAGLNTIGEDYFHEGCMLSFLPLSHGFERTCGYYLAILTGVSIAYAESIPKLISNFKEVKPTILVSVPRIYEKIFSAVLENADTPFKRKILNWAMRIGHTKAVLEVNGKPLPALLSLQYDLAYKLVFSKLHKRLGGRFRFAATGGAPLAKEIAIFLKGAGLLVIEGYGQTETAPMLTLNGPAQMRFGSVGKPIPGVELKLKPDPNGEQGDEILVRGSNVMKGYYKMEAETEAAINKDGWLHTGDIGYIDEDGYLFITDRKKELIKTSGGKFVAPAPIEIKLMTSNFIEQACVIGNKRKYCIVLIYPNKNALKEFIGKPISAQKLKENKVIEIYQSVIDSLNSELNSWEQIKKFAFLPHELSPETGEMTPTLKIKRRIVDEKFKSLIDTLY